MAEVDNTWAYLIGKKVYSTVSYKAEKILKDDYPNIKITDNGKASSKPNFLQSTYMNCPDKKSGRHLTDKT